MKRRYVYVEARAWFSTPSTTGNRAEGTLDGPISFNAVIVPSAADADEAYRLGASLMDEKFQSNPQDTHWIAADGTASQFLNDFVFPCD